VHVLISASARTLRRMCVFGRVVDVIDADCLTEPRPGDARPIRLLDDQSGPAVVVEGFPDHEAARGMITQRYFHPFSIIAFFHVSPAVNTASLERHTSDR
jgi:hypothetical protein